MNHDGVAFALCDRLRSHRRDYGTISLYRMNVIHCTDVCPIAKGDSHEPSQISPCREHHHRIVGAKFAGISNDAQALPRSYPISDVLADASFDRIHVRAFYLSAYLPELQLDQGELSKEEEVIRRVE
jgi:hypothetical protein